MKKIVQFISFIIMFALQAGADEQTWITDNLEGKVIKTPEYVIKISDYDITDTRLWLIDDNVVIIDDNYIINLDSGDKAEIEDIWSR